MQEMNNKEEPAQIKGLSTATAVVFAITISLLVAIINLFILLSSDMHDKVKLIQNLS